MAALLNHSLSPLQALVPNLPWPQIKLSKTKVDTTPLYKDHSAFYHIQPPEHQLHYVREQNTSIRALPSYSGGTRMVGSPPILLKSEFKLQFQANRSVPQSLFPLNHLWGELLPSSPFYKSQYDAFTSVRRFENRHPFNHSFQSIVGYGCYEAAAINSVGRTLPFAHSLELSRFFVWFQSIS